MFICQTTGRGKIQCWPKFPYSGFPHNIVICYLQKQRIFVSPVAGYAADSHTETIVSCWTELWNYSSLYSIIQGLTWPCLNQQNTACVHYAHDNNPLDEDYATVQFLLLKPIWYCHSYSDVVFRFDVLNTITSLTCRPNIQVWQVQVWCGEEKSH